MINSYRDLKVWQMSMEVSVAVYKETERFPKSEVFGLASQIRRAAVSVPANIAEGCSRQHTTEFLQFLYIAKGSMSELETLVDLAGRLGYLSPETARDLLGRVDELAKMTYGLITGLKNKSAAKH